MCSGAEHTVSCLPWRSASELSEVRSEGEGPSSSLMTCVSELNRAPKRGYGYGECMKYFRIHEKINMGKRQQRGKITINPQTFSVPANLDEALRLAAIKVGRLHE